MADSIIGCLGMQYKRACYEMHGRASKPFIENGTDKGALRLGLSSCAAILVGQVEVDRDDDFGLDRLAIDGSGRIAPERDSVHGDLCEQGIAADAR